MEWEKGLTGIASVCIRENLCASVCVYVYVFVSVGTCGVGIYLEVFRRERVKYRRTQVERQEYFSGGRRVN